MLLLAIVEFQKQLETIAGLDVPLVRLGITALLIAIAAAQSPCAVFCFYAEASEEGTFTDVEGESIRCTTEADGFLRVLISHREIVPDLCDRGKAPVAILDLMTEFHADWQIPEVGIFRFMLHAKAVCEVSGMDTVVAKSCIRSQGRRAKRNFLLSTNASEEGIAIHRALDGRSQLGLLQIIIALDETDIRFILDTASGEVMVHITAIVLGIILPGYAILLCMAAIRIRKSDARAGVFIGNQITAPTRGRLYVGDSDAFVYDALETISHSLSYR